MSTDIRPPAATQPKITTLEPQQMQPTTPTRDQLAHARQQAIERNFDDYYIVDVDAHHGETGSWKTILEYIEDPVMRRNGVYMTGSSMYSRTDGAEDMPMGIPASTTDAATTAAVLILSQNLSLFEFNIWYTRVSDALDRQQQKAYDQTPE